MKTTLLDSARSQRLYRMRGGSVMKMLFFVPAMFALVLLVVFAFYEGRKAYWDFRVQQMCEQDGGVTVFEKIRLNSDDYKRLKGTQGSIPIPERRSADSSTEFVSDTERSAIHQGSPYVWRTVSTIHAVDGNRVIARYVTYTRRGGDIPTFAHPSYSGCDSGVTAISKEIFMIQGIEE